MIVYVATCPGHRMISGIPLLCAHGPLTGTALTKFGRAYLSEPRTFLSWEHASAVVLGQERSSSERTETND